MEDAERLTILFPIKIEMCIRDRWKSREKRMSECLRLQTVVLLLIILKLVVPFVAEGLSELHAYSQSMTGFF